jgi:hypothetical protein
VNNAPELSLGSALSTWAGHLPRLLLIGFAVFLPWMAWTLVFEQGAAYGLPGLVENILRFVSQQVLVGLVALSLAGRSAAGRIGPLVGIGFRTLLSLFGWIMLLMIPVCVAGAIAQPNVAPGSVEPTAALAAGFAIMLVALVIYVRIMLAPVAVALDGNSSGEAMRRAIALSKGDRLRILVFLLPAYAIDLGISTVLQRAGLDVLTLRATTFAQGLATGTWLAVVANHAFLALRARKEPADPEQVAEVFA